MVKRKKVMNKRLKMYHQHDGNGRNAPEFFFYFSEGCPVCKKVREIIIDEVTHRTILNVVKVNVSFSNNVFIEWWHEVSLDIAGEDVTPMIVIWDNGFGNGSSDIYVVERKNYDILTDTLTDKVLALSPKVWRHIERFPYGRLQYA